MLLLISAVAGVLFHIAFLIRVFIRPIEEKGHLKLYSNCQVSMLFSFFNSLATIGFVMYANTDAGVRGYACSPIVYIVLLLSAAAYFLSKTLERRERVLYREHGFYKEFKKNWLLFLFLIPCFTSLSHSSISVTGSSPPHSSDSKTSSSWQNPTWAS